MLNEKRNHLGYFLTSFIFLLLFSTYSLQAQITQRITNFDLGDYNADINFPTNGDLPSVVDKDGNYYFLKCNVSPDTVSLDVGNPNAGLDVNYHSIIVAKYDRDAQHVWSFALKGIDDSSFVVPSDIAVDASNCVYLSGYLVNYVDFDPSANQYIEFSSVALTGGFVAKYDANGDFLWVKVLQKARINQIEIASDSLLYLSGLYRRGADFNPGFGVDTLPFGPVMGYHCYIASYSLDMDYIACGRLGQIEPYSLHVDSLGDFYLFAQFSPVNGVADLDPDTSTYYVHGSNWNKEDFRVLVKYSSAYEFEWARRINTDIWAGHLKPSGFHVDDSNNVYVFSYFLTTLKIGEEANYSVYTGGTAYQHGFITKIDGQGNEKWTKVLAGQIEYFSLDVDAQGDILIGTSVSSGINDFDPGPEIVNVAATNTNPVAVVAKYRGGNGSLVWLKNVESNGPGGASYNMSLRSSLNGEFYQIGMYRNSVKSVNPDSVFVLNGGRNYLALMRDTDWKYDHSKVICWDDSIQLGGQYIYAEGIYLDTLLATDGGDSIVRIALGIDSFPFYALENVVICQGDVYTFPNGDTSSTSLIHYSHLLKTSGCDSTIQTILVVKPHQLLASMDTICANDSLEYRGSYYATPGIYYDSLHSVFGCDSVYSLELAVNPVYDLLTPMEVCGNDSVWVAGQWISSPGLYTEYLTTTKGCDSAHTTQVDFTQIKKDVFYINNMLLAEEDSADSYLWISCTSEVQSVVGSNSPAFYPFQSGEYAVVMQKGSCTDTSVCRYAQVVDVIVFPSPNNGSFNISSPYDQLEMTMVDAAGNTVYSKRLEQGVKAFNFSHLAAGMYTLRFITPKGDVLYRKIVVY